MTDDAELADFLPQKTVPVCAIGASAGGVTALQGLFRQLSNSLGLAYVVILHLSPDHPSAMSEILAGCTRMPVMQIQDGPTLKPDHVYVIPPDHELVIEGDSVTARAFSEPRGRRAPIDMFFRSVAAARGDGVAIVLSGAGADGAVGVRAIKEAGGVIMVQEPAEASFPSMPQNAIATGVADFVAPLARLAERLAEVAHSKEAVRSLDMDGSANDLRRIVAFLRARTGHDFSSYKRATVMRRVIRRMQVCRTDTLVAYANYLTTTPEEAKELFSDLLISVTMFFRDPRAFEALEQQAIKPIFDDLDFEKGESVRAWVVGCATGEEAYSIAILFHEEAERRKVRPQLQIFASDLDEGALATAREGRFPRTIEADVSDERLTRFFIDEGTHYRVRKELRESVLFATHSVLKEPPFMRLDLITCRNLLIYLERGLQQQVCSIFRYGLKPGRFLFLGSAETADSTPELFVPLDREARIYGARPAVPHALPILPQFTAPERLAGVDQPFLGRADRTDLPVTLHAAALERTAPASALVDSAQNILHLSHSAGRFILHSAGPISNQLSAIVRPELRLDLKIALSCALEGKESTLTHPTVVALDSGRRRVSMHVALVPNGLHMGAQALVMFLDGGSAPDVEEIDTLPDARPDEVRRLHTELKVAQEAVVASRAGHEASIQDLRATNEELQSINEEYRSTAEELETSKEELQSINEELHTVNAELKSKLTSISVAHSDLQNLTDATAIGTLFLDAELRIKMFTPPISDLFNITKADVGRVITDFSNHLDYSNINDDARHVSRQLTPVEREVHSREGHSYVMRIRPYRTIEDRIDGVVITFFDVTDRLSAETALRESETLRKIALTGGRMGAWRWDLNARLIWADAQHLALWGLDPSDEAHPLSLFTDRMSPQGAAQMDVIATRAIDAGEEFDSPLEIVAGPTAGKWIRWRGRADSHAPSILYGVTFDITEQRRAEITLRESEVRQVFLLKLSDALRPVTDPTEVQRVATSVLGEQLGVDRALYFEVAADQDTVTVGPSYLRDIHPMPSPLKLSDFGDPVSQMLRDGKTVVMKNTLTEDLLAPESAELPTAIELRAIVGVPLVKGGRLVAILAVHQSGTRTWTETEVMLVEAVAERTWAAVERARAEMAVQKAGERQKVLLGELQHRVRNTLAVVRSITRRTAENSETVEVLQMHLDGRLGAFARTQAKVTRDPTRGVDLESIFADELLAHKTGHDERQITYGGPQLELAPKLAETLGLAVHELTTNAVKYGALSDPKARLSISWRLEERRTDEDPLLRIEWRERLSRKLPGPPQRRGFGTDLLEKTLAYDLDAEVSLAFEERGLTCTIALPFADQRRGTGWPIID